MEEKINTLLKVSLDSIKNMIDVNTVVGEKIMIGENVIVIPVSRVRMGFISGGGDLKASDMPPFTGGSGATMGITPIGFLICENEMVRFVNTYELDKIDKLCELFSSIGLKIVDYLKIKKESKCPSDIK